MNLQESIELELLIAQKLKGKLSLLQSNSEREEILNHVLTQPYTLEDQNRLERAMEHIKEPEARNIFIKEFLSYGAVHDLLLDSDVEDIIINSLQEIYVHHAQKGLIPTGKSFSSQKALDLFVKKLLLFSGRNEMHKIINLELPNLEGRVNIVSSPFGPQITITKAKVEPLSILDLIKYGSLNYEVAAQLWLYIEGLCVRPANIIIAGGPGTGKTTLLNALFSFVPSSERMVIMEDTLELNTFLESSCSRLESDDEISLQTLVKNSLRMRPDRIVIGEVRGAEARDMITAVNVGKYCLGTIHASHSREAILRLQNEPMNIPETMVNLVDVFICMRRFHVHDRVYRVVDEVSETGGMESKTILLSQIYKYDYQKKLITNMAASTVYRDQLAREAGLKPREIIDEIYVRAVLLKVLDDRKLTTMKEITTFCRAYSRDAKQSLAALGVTREEILKNRRYME